MVGNIVIEDGALRFRLVNQNCPKRTLNYNKRTWFGLLSMALEHGWNPMGAAHPEWWLLPGGDLFDGPGDQPLCGYTGETHTLVLFEDALNLADALETAVQAYEPEWIRFQEWGEVSLAGVALWGQKVLPSLGAMDCLVAFCRQGAFQIQHLE
jgi:hypothetical protein